MPPGAYEMSPRSRRSHHTRGSRASWNKYRQVHVEAIWRAERIHLRQEESPSLVLLAKSLLTFCRCVRRGVRSRAPFFHRGSEIV
jgi:hypothetical protein